MKLKVLLCFLGASNFYLNASESSIMQEIKSRTPAQIALVEKNIQTLMSARACVRCYLVGANLAGMNLQRAHLAGAVLRGAQAPGASFNSADLTDADFSNAYLKGADFTNITTSVKTKFTGADVTDTIFDTKKKEKPVYSIDGDDNC